MAADSDSLSEQWVKLESLTYSVQAHEDNLEKQEEELGGKKSDMQEEILELECELTELAKKRDDQVNESNKFLVSLSDERKDKIIIAKIREAKGVDASAEEVKRMRRRLEVMLGEMKVRYIVEKGWEGDMW
jgi:chromosome segregation ATPase